jgi:hypothetical protein
VQPAVADADAGSSSRRVLLGWALLFALTSTLTALTAAPLVELVWAPPRREQVLRAIQLVRRGRTRRNERQQFEDIYAAYAKLARGKPPAREALQAALSELVEEGLLARESGSGLELTPAGAALLREGAAEPAQDRRARVAPRR